MWGRRETHIGFWWGNVKQRNHYEDLGIRCKNDIKKDLKEIGWGGVASIYLLRRHTSDRILITWQ
jgi:hypothetical protein